MIKAQIKKTKYGLSGFVITGHADAAAYGQDIVCAAVSALTITTANSLSQIAGLHPQIDQNETQGGYLAVQLSAVEQKNQRGQILLQNLQLGLAEIANEYQDYVTLQS
ncbi:putative ribosomal protein [Fructilactobacillus florum 8D]|uniref:Ribosomal processing cysteine protease Prp n=2 Tax=Fructilactobacillus florum TaxID=640331 RepID=W9EKH1_9LACO|nr:ribosomal-processing cysteine protease Prp [Fructilactobacillus florum]EKK20713.1 putative ribosomal protein [Fructilactobacillus florum 2F]ETO40179.1 putative ribosomal protein [Fructilactobacillus florum 8D]KRM91803.1 hypothetical protein FC87_GL000627 [Fructilactobacillus florum DSM 22689 = JCM 16035]